MINEMNAAIFDLDGVIVDTAKYHYLAWKRLANNLGFDFTERQNERLKGVSRTRSLEILLEIGDLNFDESTLKALAAQKNAWYVELIRGIKPSELLPGAVDYVHYIKERGVRTALASASENAPLILECLNIQSLFDVVIEGNKVRQAKPDPEIFTRADLELGIMPEECVVFEDAEAGIEAARRAGMGSVGVGRPGNLQEADLVIGNFHQLLVIGLMGVNIEEP